MRNRDGMKSDLKMIKRELRAIKRKTDSRALKVKREVGRNYKKRKEADSDKNLLKVLEYFIEESKATRTKMDKILEKLEQFEAAGTQYEDSDLPHVAQPAIARPQTGLQPDFPSTEREVVMDGPDAKIIGFVSRQPHGMACADDVKKAMGYKGRNAASARLNRLYKQGFLERYQHSHRVYYRFTAGKVNERIRIITPPEENK